MSSTYKWVLFDMYDTLVLSSRANQYLYENKVLWKIFKKNNIIINRQSFYEKLHELKNKFPQNKPLPKNKILEQELAKIFGYNITYELAKKIHKEQYKTNKSRAILAPHAKSLLNWLKVKKIKIAIISNAHTRGLLYNLEQFKIKEYFDEIIVSDAVKGLKSELIPFKHFLHKHPKIKPEECLMIGDSIYEDIASQKLGIPSCILEFNLSQISNHRIEKLKSEGLFPKYRINSLTDIKKIIENKKIK